AGGDVAPAGIGGEFAADVFHRDMAAVRHQPRRSADISRRDIATRGGQHYPAGYVFGFDVSAAGPYIQSVIPRNVYLHSHPQPPAQLPPERLPAKIHA